MHPKDPVPRGAVRGSFSIECSGPMAPNRELDVDKGAQVLSSGEFQQSCERGRRLRARRTHGCQGLRRITAKAACPVICRKRARHRERCCAVSACHEQNRKMSGRLILRMDEARRISEASANSAARARHQLEHLLDYSNRWGPLQPSLLRGNSRRLDQIPSGRGATALQHPCVYRTGYSPRQERHYPWPAPGG
jgi:hypothetical protein